MTSSRLMTAQYAAAVLLTAIHKTFGSKRKQFSTVQIRYETEISDKMLWNSKKRSEDSVALSG